MVAASVGRSVRVEVTGRGDSTGTEEANRTISRLRAERVTRALASGGAAGLRFTIRGVGTSQPLRREVTEKDRELNRSVTVSVIFAEAPAAEALGR